MESQAHFQTNEFASDCMLQRVLPTLLLLRNSATKQEEALA